MDKKLALLEADSMELDHVMNELQRHGHDMNGGTVADVIKDTCAELALLREFEDVVRANDTRLPREADGLLSKLDALRAKHPPAPDPPDVVEAVAQAIWNRDPVIRTEDEIDLPTPFGWLTEEDQNDLRADARAAIACLRDLKKL